MFLMLGMFSTVSEVPPVSIHVCVVSIALDAIGGLAGRVRRLVVKPEPVVAGPPLVARDAYELAVLFSNMIFDAISHFEANPTVITDKLFVPLFVMSKEFFSTPKFQFTFHTLKYFPMRLLKVAFRLRFVEASKVAYCAAVLIIVRFHMAR